MTVLFSCHIIVVVSLSKHIIPSFPVKASFTTTTIIATTR